MALSEKAQQSLEIALASKALGEEVAAAIDSQGSGPADYVAPIGVTSNLSALAVVATNISASNMTAADADEPTKAEIDAGIDAVVAEIETALNLKADNADCETLRTQVEARMDVIEAKLDLLLAKLVASEQMAAS